MSQPLQIRTDIVFQLADDALGDAAITYHLNDFLVRVEKIVPNENEVRYGVMVDFSQDDAFGKKSYIIEIPVEASNAQQRKVAQETIINEYIDEMREKFAAFYQEATSTKGVTVDEFDRMPRYLASADGKWDIYRKFRLHHLTPFTEWLLEAKFDTKQMLDHYLTRSRMAFETSQDYLISVDWVCPYICYEQEIQVSHFKEGYDNVDLFRPFHNYAWQKEALASKITIDRDTVYSEVYQSGIKIKPNNYALFAFYCHILDQICLLQQENYEAIKHYHTYLQNLGAIQSLLIQHGPLTALSQTELETIIQDTDISNWDGDTKNHDNKLGLDKEHYVQFKMGLDDIDAAMGLFTQIIQEESTSGRNKKRTADIEELAHKLKVAFFDNAIAQANYSDLWCYNKDRFGFDLFTHKILLTLSTMRDADTIYKEFLHANLYEHPILNDPNRGYKAHDVDLENWGNILYRVDGITFDTVISYLSNREAFTKFAKKEFFQKQVLPETPLSGEIADWIKENVLYKQNVNYQSGVKINSSTPSQHYTEWTLNDEQIRKLANYLNGGGKIDELMAIEARIAAEIKAIFAGVNFKDIPFDEINKLHEQVLKLKESIIIHVPNTTHNVEQTSFVSSSVINLLLATVVYSNAYSENSTLENKLRAHSLAVGLFSDTANAIAKVFNIQATLSLSNAAKTNVSTRISRLQPLATRLAPFGARISLGLGTLQAIGGGVGGALGFAWFTYDALKSYNEGFTKDAILDGISAVGCLVGLWSLKATGTIIGFKVGVILSIVSFVLVAVAQVLKYMRTFNNDTEDLCKHLNGKSIDEGGMNRFREWFDELTTRQVALPMEMSAFTLRKPLEDLLERVDDFITDGDTYDKVTELKA